MDLDVAIKGMLDAQANLRVPTAVANPGVISKEMYRLAQYATAVENELAHLEEEYEATEGEIYRRCMIDEKKSATAAEKYVKIEIGPMEGKIKYLARITGAAWKLHGDLQSRVKHIQDEMKGSI